MPFKTIVCPTCEGNGQVSGYRNGREGDPEFAWWDDCWQCEGTGRADIYVPEQLAPRQPDMTWHELSAAMVGYGIVAALFVAVIYGERIAAWWHGVIA